MSRGFDLRLAAVLAGGLKLSGTVGYTDAYYPKSAYGAAMNGVAPWSASLHVDYSRDIGWLGYAARSYVRVD